MKITKKCAWIAGLQLLAATLLAEPISQVNQVGEYQPEYLETAKPGEFLQKQALSSETLVILDLDDTTITTPEGQWLGRSDMFYDLLAREQKAFPGKEKSDLAATIDVLLTAIYQRMPVTLTDHSLPAVLQSLQDKGVSVIAMTSRGHRVRAVTLRQLKQVNIRLTDLGEPRWVDLDNNRTFRVEENGVVFVSHGNKKGEVLARLLEDGVFKNIKEIYLIDDRKRHLDDVKTMLEHQKTPISFVPVLCTYLDGKQPYNSSVANQQLMTFLIDHKEVPEIKSLIKNDPYTKRIADMCLSVLPDKTEECLSIFKSTSGL